MDCPRKNLVGVTDIRNYNNPTRIQALGFMWEAGCWTLNIMVKRLPSILPSQAAKSSSRDIISNNRYVIPALTSYLKVKRILTKLFLFKKIIRKIGQ